MTEPASTRGFFGGWGDSFTAGDPDELLHIRTGIDIKVPLPGQGRTSDHRERYCIVRHLRHLHEVGLLRYPVRITKNRPGHGSPDFFIDFPNGRRVGLEHTDVGPQSYRKAEALAEPDTRVASLDLCYFTKHPRTRSVARLKKGLVPVNGRLRTPGWLDDEVESRWARFVIAGVEKKRKKLKAGGYDQCDEYELLAYDCTTLMCLDRDRGLAALRARTRGVRPFTRITIMDDSDVLYAVLPSGFARGSRGLRQ